MPKEVAHGTTFLVLSAMVIQLMYLFRITLSWKIFTSLLILYTTTIWVDSYFLLGVKQTSLHSLLVFETCAEKSVLILMCMSFRVTCCYSLIGFIFFCFVNFLEFGYDVLWTGSFLVVATWASLYPLYLGIEFFS